tara:strand:+ start:6571 stop:8895 length:2325 start_codon:yes stop_codon:yes gene_type:complete
MSTVAKKMMMGSVTDSAYTINQSLIFDKTDAASLVRTPSSASNQRTWTWSGWVKRLETNGSEIFTLFSADGSSDNSYICFYLDDIYINDYEAGVGTKWQLTTNRKFRDFAAWYHIVFAVDTTQGTDSNRLKLYVNGVQETSFSAASYPAQNYDGFVNSTKEHHVGTAFTSASTYSLGGQLAEVNFVDGSQLAPSSFGETNSDTNQWIPKKYSGSYGTNGFYLKFVSGALGTDSSGEGNNFTSANLADADVVTDTPTNNFCTLNPLSNYNATLTQGNLVAAQAGHSDTTATFQVPFTGKWYFECVATTSGAAQLGISPTSYTVSAGSWVASVISLIFSNGQAGTGSGSAYIGSAIANGNTVGVAIDSDNGKIYFAKNNTWGNSGNPLNGTNPAATFTATDGWRPIIYGPSGAVQTFNFGQKDFAYTPPSGFSALSTSNLPDPAIAIPSANFNPHIYTGTNNTNAITGVGFQPDLVWVKQRDVAYNHQLHDAVRGAAAGLLMSDNNAGENSGYPIASFDSDGFTPASGNVTGVNTGSMVGWFWKANGAGSTDTSGDIDATVSANSTAGFSIVKYIANGTAGATVPHGLGVAPEMVFYKRYDANSSWFCWTTAIDGSDDYMVLNGTDAATAVTSTQSGGASFTSSFIRAVNYSNTNTIVAYCFASKDAYSSIGSYTGNGSADGPTIVTGFKPALVITKRTDATGYWGIFDAARALGNVAAFPALFPNVSDAEVTGTYLDLLSNGFKIRITSAHYNASGGTYLYMAFAESPFKTANAR